jgi:hypothetical protein
MKMIQVTILGTTLEAALLNHKVARKYDEGIKSVIATVNESQNADSGADGIEMQCNAVIRFVDDIFGTGSARKVLGEETDLLTCLEAWRDITNLYEEQVAPIVQEYSNAAIGAANNGAGMDAQ